MNNMKLYSVLVTGANRGIGYEFVTQLVNLPDPPQYVFATYRDSNTAKDLNAIRDDPNIKSTLHLIKVDMTKKSDLESAMKIIEDVVGEKGLTLLINNAGIAKFEPFPKVTEEILLANFSVNAVGPLLAFQIMLPLLKKAASTASSSSGMTFSRAGALNISSIGGCITKADTPSKFTNLSYQISKAALNMAMRVAAAEVKDDNILFVNICPGWVKTDMGSDKAQLTPEESISQMLSTISKMNEENHGTFVDRFGKPYPF